MNLYLLTPYREAWYDDVVSTLVRARSSTQARKLAHEAHWTRSESLGSKPFDWRNRFDVKLTKIGEATPGTKQTEGVVITDVRGG